jgi:hypothetical protein
MCIYMYMCTKHYFAKLLPLYTLSFRVVRSIDTNYSEKYATTSVFWLEYEGKSLHGTNYPHFRTYNIISVVSIISLRSINKLEC